MKFRKYVKNKIVAIILAVIMGISNCRGSMAQCNEDYLPPYEIEEAYDMKTQYGFTRFDSLSEFKTWLGKQGNYNYTGIQVHHTGSPEYKHFYKSNGTHEDELTRQNSMKSFHVNTNGWSDIAQHFTVFPNGKIVTGRSLSKTTAIGITGWNSNKICIEIYGNFDKGKDVMKPEQKEAVIALYGELCKKFNISPSTSTIRPHAWFTSGGTCLGTYVAGKSRKTCPGTNFMGFGNTKEAFEKNFIPMIKNYISNGTTNTEPIVTPTPSTSYVPGVYKVNTDSLSVRTGPGTSYGVATSVKRGESYTITEVQNGWGKLKSGVGWIGLSYCQLVKATEPEFRQYIVRTKEELNGRKAASASSELLIVVAKGTAVTIVGEEMNGNTKWLKTKTGYYLSADYTEFVRYVS